LKHEIEIRSAIEKNLSGLELTAAHRAAIREKIYGGEKMKKKMPVALVLALVLALVSVTAVAVSNWDQVKDYLKTVRFLSYEAIYEWTLDEKMKLVDAMHKAEFEMDEEAYEKISSGSLSDEEKEAICDAIIESRYGENWRMNDIEEFEWPLELRKQSEENMREYDMWQDAVMDQWVEEHPSKLLNEEPITEEWLMERFLGMMTEVWGFSLESIDQNQIEIVITQEICSASYTITAENPGQYCLSMKEIEAGMQEKTMMQHMEEKQGKQETYTFRYRTDIYGNELSYTTEPMEKEMVKNMESCLTEIFGFQYGSYDASLIQVEHLKEQKLWMASYTITEENPGLWELTLDEIEAGVEPLTMLEYKRRAEGKKDSFTFRCYYSEWGDYVPADRVGEQGAIYTSQYYPKVSAEEAVDIARKALDEKYPVSLKELEELNVRPGLYGEMDGSHEYYIEFIGYEYSENLARIWSYAARVNADNGEVLAAIKHDEWNPLTGRKLVEDASPEMQQIIWEHHMMDALRRAAGDHAGNGWPLNFNEAGKYFYDWSLEDKAAYSQRMKPLMDAFLQENPDYAELLQKRYEEEQADGPGYYNTTRHAYGLPDEKSISREKAQEMARNAVLEKLEAEEKYLDGAGKINVYYDVTDPEKPLWKFFFNTINLAVYPEDAWGYMVYLDAYTGEIEKCFIRTVETSMIDLM